MTMISLKCVNVCKGERMQLRIERHQCSPAGNTAVTECGHLEFLMSSGH